MNAHYFKHVPFEDIGSIRSWLTTAGHTITCTPFFKSANLPALEKMDLLIVMGGPMSVNDEKRYPWLVPEKQFIHEMILSGKPVLGICLGAQLIAGAMGAKVYPDCVKEIGWFPVYGVSSGDPSVFRFPQSVQVFHWHGQFDYIFLRSSMSPGYIMAPGPRSRVRTRMTSSTGVTKIMPSPVSPV